MAKRRIRVRPIAENAETERVRCPACRNVFAVERGRLFAMCPRCGEIVARDAPPPHTDNSSRAA